MVAILEDIFKVIFLHDMCCIVIRILMIQIMAGRQKSDKLLVNPCASLTLIRQDFFTSSEN